MSEPDPARKGRDVVPPSSTPSSTLASPHDRAADGHAHDPPASFRGDRNRVILDGTVSGQPERRVLPSGDEVVSLRLVVRRPDEGQDTVPVQVGPGPGPGRRPGTGQVGRRQLAAAERLVPGSRLEVVGVIRRRWWQTPGGRRSRIEVQATALRTADDA